LRGTQPIAKLVQHTPRAINQSKEQKGNDEGTKGLDEQSVHPLMILKAKMKETLRIVIRAMTPSIRAVRELCRFCGSPRP
jgi:hypothetical protein